MTLKSHADHNKMTSGNEMPLFPFICDIGMLIIAKCQIPLLKL